MYEYLKGKITYISPYYIVVEVFGVGYQVFVANPFKYSSSLEQEKTVYLYQAVREDAIKLYGFMSLEEKDLFEKLIQVSGIGPKSALAIMAGEDHLGLVQAIDSEDFKYLTKFPGVGKKTAQQMILDLKGKLDELAVDQFSSPTPNEEQLSLEFPDNTKQQTQALEEAKEALKALGYSSRDLTKIEKDLLKAEEDTTDGYLRLALKLLMKK